MIVVFRFKDYYEKNLRKYRRMKMFKTYVAILAKEKEIIQVEDKEKHFCALLEENLQYCTLLNNPQLGQNLQ